MEGKEGSRPNDVVPFSAPECNDTLVMVRLSNDIVRQWVGYRGGLYQIDASLSRFWEQEARVCDCLLLSCLSILGQLDTLADRIWVDASRFVRRTNPRTLHLWESLTRHDIHLILIQN